MKTTHEDIKRHFTTLAEVYKVFDCMELPNRYGANVSYFTVKYNHVIDGNFESVSRFDFTIDWSRNVLFISNKGYFPFSLSEEVLPILIKYFN